MVTRMYVSYLADAQGCQAHGLKVRTKDAECSASTDHVSLSLK